MIGAGFLHLPPVRHAFPILKNRLLPQNSGKFKKTGFSGQALNRLGILRNTVVLVANDSEGKQALATRKITKP